MFGIGKKKEETQTASGCCCNTQANQAQKATCCCGSDESNPSGTKAESGCVVKILGSGCKNCHALYENTKAAVAAMGRKDSIAIEYVTDMPTIMGYGVMSMPALVCCEKVVSMGKVLKPVEVQKLLEASGC